MRRRAFLQGIGLVAGGLAVGIFDRRSRADAAGELRPNAFVHIAPDGTVTIVCARSEMGQGVRSSLPSLIADELGADPARIQILQAEADEAYGNQNTDGSSSVRGVYDELRRHGAVARVLLIRAAADQWKALASDCDTHDHAVFHKPSGKSIGFGALVAAAAKLPVPKAKDVALRPKVVRRRNMPLVDGPDIVTGRARYGADVRLPDMLIAVVARPPVVGGKVKSFDAGKAQKVAGVKRILELKGTPAPYAFHPLGGIAVVATDTWAAMKARALLDITWDHGSNADYDSKRFSEAMTATAQKPGKVVRSHGKTTEALAAAKKRVVADYHTPHLAHAAMEPLAAIAWAKRGSCEVWAPTQDPQTAQKEVAHALGLKPKDVTIHVTFLGGAFGRKSKPDFIVEAALLSKEVGVPVRVQWTREDDMQHDYYHSTSSQHLEAGLDGNHRVVAWLHRTVFPSISTTFKAGVKHGGEGELQQGVTDLPLDVPNVQCEVGDADAHARIGWLRSVCNIFHAFAVGSFLDEVAHARGVDPHKSLLDIYGPARRVGKSDLGVDELSNYNSSLDQHPIDVGRLRHVIERATELSGWSKRGKRAFGLAAHRSFLTYVAVVAAVRHDDAGKIHVDEVWIVADAGTIVNEDRVRSQMEGAVVFGIGIALHSAITFQNGAVEQSNFHDYRVARIGEAPRQIHVEIVDSDGPSGGVGEPGVPPVAPAIANAVFALTGKRHRQLPIS